MPLDEASGVYWEAHGAGAPVMIGLPLMASHTAIFGAAAAGVLSGYLDRLTDRYRVLLIDYPSIGRSRDIAPADLTADRVCADLLGVADAAGAKRFAYWGYSWSGAVGLQLAHRTDRLSALVIGGWPPLGAPYGEILAVSRARAAAPALSPVLRTPEQYAQWPAYYASMIDWPERAAVEAIRCPRMAIFGGDGDLDEDGTPIRIASINRAHRDELEAIGWTVAEIAGQGHEVAMRPELIVPPVRAFLDTALAS